MAIAAYPATLKISTNVIQDIMLMEYPFKMENVETTAFGGSGGAAVGTKTFIPTLLTATIKANGSWAKTDTTGQALLETAFFARTLTTLIFSPNGTNTYTMACWVVDYLIKADTKGKVDVDFTLLMNGTVVLA